ncbi:RDD family protein [Flammeovirga sp. SJP92]|uniref:RDD family protein n=1 Tax=Flammeovirga sp. SJP92 TaxID=1775430 RepID=UPI00078769B9|nr:RDD family protein [Flammeovirga sp. SJP92]KXX69507.1 hypothetical protein AVL50_15660 [Flammeovirga sp. SJP92]
MNQSINFKYIQKKKDLRSQLFFRTSAFLLDFYVFKFILGLIFYLVFEEYVFVETFSAEDLVIASSKITLMEYVFYILYCSIFEASNLRGTLGKRFFKLSVNGTHDGKISLWRALLRNSIKPFSIISLVGVIIIDLTKKKQALHDLLAGTVVTLR